MLPQKDAWVEQIGFSLLLQEQSQCINVKDLKCERQQQRKSLFYTHKEQNQTSSVDRIRTLVIPSFLKNGVSTNIDVVSSKVQKVMDDETLATLDTNLLFGRFRPALELEKYI